MERRPAGASATIAAEQRPCCYAERALREETIEIDIGRTGP